MIYMFLIVSKLSPTIQNGSYLETFWDILDVFFKTFQLLSLLKVLSREVWPEVNLMKYVYPGIYRINLAKMLQIIGLFVQFGRKACENTASFAVPPRAEKVQ